MTLKQALITGLVATAAGVVQVYCMYLPIWEVVK